MRIALLGVAASTLAACVSGPLPDARYEAAILTALREADCGRDVAPGASESELARRFAAHLPASADALLDPTGPHYDRIDQAIERMDDDGRLILDERARTLRLPGCAA